MYIIFEIIITDASCVYDHIYLTWKNQIQGRPIHFYPVGKELKVSHQLILKIVYIVYNP